MDLHIIFTDSAVLLSRKSYASWRQIQDEIENYKASLGPMTPDAAIAWLGEEYSGLSPDASEQVRRFLDTSEDTVAVTLKHSPSSRRATLVLKLLKSKRALPAHVVIAVVLLGAIGALRLWLAVPRWLMILAALVSILGVVVNAVNVLHCRRALRLLPHERPRA